MKRKSETVAVATCDIVHSSRYSARDRRQIQNHLLKSWASVQRDYGPNLLSRLSFRVTAGDEFQFVCRDMATALEIITTLRLKMKCLLAKPTVVFRAAMAWGERAVSGGADPYAQDGPAFHLAREGMERLKQQKEQLTAVASTGENTAAEVISEMMPLLDLLYRNWTPGQCEVILLVREGKSGDAVARRLRISASAVSQRLAATNWRAYARAMGVIQRVLKDEIKMIT